MKTCVKCKESKPLDAFYLKGGSPIGTCKVCYSGLQRKRWLASKEPLFDWKKRLAAVGYRFCSKCKDAKPFDQFTPQRGDKLSPWCRPCYNVYYHERRVNNPTVRAYEKKARERWIAKNPEKPAEWNAKNWHKRKHRDSYYAYLIAMNDIPRELVTQEMIDFKRAQMNLQRLLKEKKNEHQ